MRRAPWWPMLLALLLAGCAGSRINAQWSDPQFAGQPARGTKVLVACQASEPTLRRMGERGDIIRTMQRALTARNLERAAGELAVLQPGDGRLVGDRPETLRIEFSEVRFLVGDEESGFVLGSKYELRPDGGKFLGTWSWTGDTEPYSGNGTISLDVR